MPFIATQYYWSYFGEYNLLAETFILHYELPNSYDALTRDVNLNSVEREKSMCQLSDTFIFTLLCENDLQELIKNKVRDGEWLWLYAVLFIEIRYLF